MRRWTKLVYELLYEQLTTRFGPACEWDSPSRPGRGLNEAYDQFLKEFQALIGAEGDSPVQRQINYAFPISEGGRQTWDRGHGRIAMLNKVAAYHAGFIGANTFPRYLIASDHEEMEAA